METTKTLNEQLTEQTFIDPGMVSSALDYWLTDNEHIRSPFPKRIHEQLVKDSTGAILLWASRLNEQAKKEQNDDTLAERFEEILFESALQMVNDEDEKITIRYPFMPRVGDPIKRNDENGAEIVSTIIKRAIDKRGDEVFLIIEHRDGESGAVMKDEFELPE